MSEDYAIDNTPIKRLDNAPDVPALAVYELVVEALWMNFEDVDDKDLETLIAMVVRSIETRDDLRTSYTHFTNPTRCYCDEHIKEFERKWREQQER